MANVKDDEFETLDFADESEYMDEPVAIKGSVKVKLTIEWPGGHRVEEMEIDRARRE